MRLATCLATAALAVSLLPLDLGAQSGGYRTIRDGRELAAEVFHWSGRTLDATADVPFAGHRIETRTVYDAAYEPLSYDLRVLALATGAVQQVVHVTFGDSVRWTVEGQPGAAARAVPPPRAVMQNLLWSHLAAMARRLAPQRDTTLTLHTFLVDNGMALDLTLASRGGRVTAAVAGTEVVLVTSAAGDLDSAEVPSQGLRIERVPPESVSASRPLVTQAQVPPPAGVVEEPFAWQDGPQRLEGTLALPAPAAGRVPVALIIAGSGPTDRDGNNPLGVHSEVYRKLAWGARAAWHREREVLGAPVVGVVTMAGAGRPLTAVLREQLARQLDSVQLAAYDRTVAAYLADGPMPVVDSSLRALLNPSVRRFLQTESAIDPAAEARRLPVPLLVLQGATDIQVSVADAEALRAARPDAEVHVVPETSHMFVRAASRDPVAQAPGYRDASAALVPELVPLLVAFVERVAR